MLTSNLSTSKKILLPLLALVVLIVTAGECSAPLPPGAPSVDNFDATQQGDTLTVDFNWTVSDPDGDTLECTLDVDGDGTADYTIADCAANTGQAHSYDTPDTYTATLEVSDGSNADDATTTIDLSQVVQCPNPERLTSSYNEDDRTLTNRALPMQCVDYVVDISGFPKIYQVGAFGSGMTLTVEPGVVIAVADGQFIDILGGATLVAQGTTDLPIVFTGVTQSPGAWAGLRLNGEARLEHVTLEYAGGRDLTSSNYNDPANLVVVGGTLQMSNSTVRDGAGYGMFVQNSVDVPVFDNNTVTANALGAISTDARPAHYFDANNDYTGNTVDKIFVNPKYSQIVGDVTWEAINVPFVITDESNNLSLLVERDDSLTLDPGVTVEIEENTVLALRGGRLISEGTELEQIAIRNVPGEPNFGGILIDDGSGAFAYTTIDNGGSVALGFDNINANVVITSFTGSDNLVGSATFGEGMAQSGAPFGLGFDNWGGSVGTTIASGVGCGAMAPIYRPDPDDVAGQCSN